MLHGYALIRGTLTAEVSTHLIQNMILSLTIIYIHIQQEFSTSYEVREMKWIYFACGD